MTPSIRCFTWHIKLAMRKYLNAALHVYDWSERQVSQPDGSWTNDVLLSSWQGITVFRVIALAEALRHHGGILDAATRRRWTDRLAKAAKFLDNFITIKTGNINYPVTSTYAFALCGELLDEDRYTRRAHLLANAAIEYFTPNQLLFGEGHPQTAISRKGCRPVDLGYNVEESLPARFGPRTCGSATKRMLLAFRTYCISLHVLINVILFMIARYYFRRRAALRIG